MNYFDFTCPKIMHLGEGQGRWKGEKIGLYGKQRKHARFFPVYFPLFKLHYHLSVWEWIARIFSLFFFSCFSLDLSCTTYSCLPHARSTTLRPALFPLMLHCPSSHALQYLSQQLGKCHASLYNVMETPLIVKCIPLLECSTLGSPICREDVCWLRANLRDG